MRPAAKLLVRFAVSLGLLVFLYSRLDWAQVWDMLGRAELVYLPVLILIMMASRVWMAWKWRMLLRAIAPAPGLYDAVRVYYMSSFQGLLLPLGGLGPDLVRYVHLRFSGASPQAVAASIVLERLVGLLATLTVTAVSIGLLLLQLDVSLVPVESGIVWGGTLFAFVLGALLFCKPLQRWLYGCLKHGRPFRQFSRFQSFIDTLKQYQVQQRIILINYGLSAAEQLFPVLSFYLGFRMFHVPVPFIMCLAVLPLGMLLQRLPIGYAGIGIREGALVFLFGLLGISYADVLVVSTMMFVFFLFSLLPGVVWSVKATPAQVEDDSQSVSA
ncbi:flippase-like domain-containing protein [Rhodocaloribacter litoris]|uniref:lysylphosphatidylglycerol synthase transmembrane domain-containing protein n=1 Tax=Rhodocaloribacter litoris TaxID=2558931 RepID=UPI00141E1755|nr:lysylphosphatidylglycerol synthase transmembrane domain-containing protein [Rhodocaloribacter litoris]QXD16200.1 flippase-like domain-containing protein [Rhodocaloribacter litoris]